MIKTRIPRKQRLLLDNVSWKRYTQFLRAFSGRHIRLTYDRGWLEIMTLSYYHEYFARFLARLILVLTEEFNLTVRSGGSMTFRLQKKLRGIEPDDCFWIANAPAIHGKLKIDLDIDPPPDLGLEVDITHSSIDRMKIYAKMKVPEVWRHSESGLEFRVLGQDGKYTIAETSPTFPLAITPEEITRFLQLRERLDDNEVIRQFREWIRARIAA